MYACLHGISQQLRESEDALITHVGCVAQAHATLNIGEAIGVGEQERPRVWGYEGGEVLHHLTLFFTFFLLGLLPAGISNPRSAFNVGLHERFLLSCCRGCHPQLDGQARATPEGETPYITVVEFSVPW